MIIPYKVKNPPKHFPIATVTLIGLNVFAFAVTSHHCLAIRPEVVSRYALVWGASPPVTILTAMFLHADLVHLLGNMLFLWIFGPAVEDRLGIVGYLGLYLLAGFAGDVAQAALGAAGAIGALVPMIGASGCIMGVLGAYWYMYAWSPVCLFYWIGWLWRGTFQVAAIWVIGAYFAMDLTNGLFARSLGAVGGVANFAHVGGALCGLVLVWALGQKRDSGELSKAKAARAEFKDVSLLTCAEMWHLVVNSPEDEDLLADYATKAMRDGDGRDVKLALNRDLKMIVTRCPAVAVHYLIVSQGSAEIFPPGDLLFLGRWCESSDRSGHAIVIYEQVQDRYPDWPEMEMALFRTATICWRVWRNGHRALLALNELLERFPTGRLMFEAEDLKREIAGGLGGINLNAA